MPLAVDHHRVVLAMATILLDYHRGSLVERGSVFGVVLAPIVQLLLQIETILSSFLAVRGHLSLASNNRRDVAGARQ